MNCEVCGAEAFVNVAEVQAEGGCTERNLCLACAAQMGLPAEAGFADTVRGLRRLVLFIKQNNRMPSEAELLEMGGAGAMPSPEPGSQQFNDQLRYWEALIDFLERHGRPPTDDELSEPP